MEKGNKDSLIPKTNRGLKTKQKLLNSAEFIFGELGYFQAGITDITKEANVSLGTFYTYYHSKEDIFRYLVMSLQQNLRKEIVQKTHGISNRIELERQGFKVFFQFLQKRPYLLRLIRQAEFVDKKLHRQYFETFIGGYIDGLSAAIKKGQIRDIDPELLVYCIMGISDYIGMKWVLWEKREIDDKFIDELMSFIKHGISISNTKL